ncbi:hypothetical protein [Aestuariivirga sp.]|uniref:DUF7507 domain-containing protein n=1 Tax=Aestuariivirga sp. TaxID=2650926 RepID=UPI0037834EC2
MPKLGSSARAVLFALSLLVAGFAAGEARATDWVVNINDTGFDPIPAGGTVVYTVTVRNDDLATATAPANTVRLTIPANAIFEGGSAGDTITGCAPVPATGPATVTCSLPALAGGEAATLRARVLTSTPGTITVDAFVPIAGDRQPQNNDVSQSTTVTQGADISLTISGPATAQSGSTVSYSYTARNLGPFAASNVVVSVPVPAGIANFQGPPGCAVSGANLVCTIPGPLAVDATASLSFTGQVIAAATSTVTVSGSVTGSTPPDPNPDNNTGTFNTAITPGSDLRITKSRAPTGTPVVGDRVTFTLGASYTGEEPFNLTITDNVPAVYSIVSVTPSAGSGWTCSVTGQLVQCSLPSGSGAGANIPLGSITIEADVVSAGQAQNTATMAAQGPPDPDLSNNTASDTQVTVEEPKADLAAIKSGPTSVVQGQSYNFSISTVNLGNRPFTGTVVMTDNLPAGLRVTAYTLNGWACTPAVPVEGAAAIRCERSYTDAAPLAVNSFTPQVTLTATVTASGNITNSMTVTTLNPNWPDPNLINNTASITSTSTDPAAVADVQVVKRADLGTVGAGDVQTFRIELINRGPTAAANVTLIDNFSNLINNAIGPNGAGMVSVSPPADAASGLRCSLEGLGGATGTSGRMTCTIASLPVCTPGADCPGVVVSVRPGGVAGLRINVASATTATPDSNPNNNSGFATYTVAARADVSVSKTVTPASPAAGQDFTYVVTARTEPDGRSTAENVTIEDTLPDGLIFVSATPSTGSCTTTPTLLSDTRSGNNKVICNLGSIPSGAQQTVQIVVRPGTALRGDSITNLVTVSTSTSGDVAGNNNFTLTTPVQNPILDLQVNKTDSPDPSGIGGTMTYTVTVNNNGPSAAENVVVTDTLPASGLAFRSYTIPPDGSCSLVPLQRSVGGTLRCGFPLLPANQSRVITITMEGVAKDVVDNIVAVSSDEVADGFDTNLGNNEDRETTTVTTRVDLAVTKVPSSPAVAVGQPFTFTITLLNRQDGALTESENTQLTDTLPAGMELTGAPSASVATGTASQNSCSGAAGGTSFLCNFGTVSSGGLITITVPVRIIAVQSLPQSFTNTATAATTSLDIDPSNDTASGTVTVNPAPDARLGIDKVLDRHEDVDGNGFISASDRLVYTITATNTGTATLTNVVVTDTRITPGSETCASVVAGGTCVLTGALTVTAADAQAGDIVNVATADSAETGPVQDSLSVAVLLPRLEIEKLNTGYEDVDGNGIISVSDGLTYTITATNTGTATLTNVVVTDTRITPNSTTCASVVPRGTCVLSGSLTVTEADVTAGRVDNTATADSNETPSVEDVLSVPVFDAKLIIEKLNTGHEDVDGNGIISASDRLTYTITATNTGTATLTTVVVTDSRITPNSTTCASVAPRGTCVLTGSLTVTAADAEAGEIVNTATADSAETEPARDTVTVPVLVAQLIIEKRNTGHEDVDGSGSVSQSDRLTYTITATNTGTATLTNVVVTDSRITPSSITCASIAPRGTCVLTGSLTVTAADAEAGEIVNTATADSNETGEVEDTVLVPVVKPSGKPTLSKTAEVTTVKRGERVPYVIIAQNVRFSPARIVDIMPPGFAYDEGSAAANGTRVSPSIDGRSLTFDGLIPDGKGAIRLELTLIATASAAVGDNVNQAQLIDPATGGVVASARARVSILDEAVFDCSDIIGKVFDDQNRNGYQDEGEPGLPGVRLATVRGLLITTDPHGRFSIACADIPDVDIGSNFIVKLDARTLPAGYRVTTENPRKVRLTRGKIVKLNFGAAGTRLVKLDLNAQVFEPGHAALKPKWQSGLQQLVTMLEAEPSRLRITYVGEDGKLARARLKSVIRDIQRRWADAGGDGPLAIETRIIGGKSGP